MSFDPDTWRVLPYVCKQDGEADKQTENAVKKYLQEVPVPK
jgi:hypothetical protein